METTPNEEVPTILVNGRLWQDGDPTCPAASRFVKKLEALGFIAFMGYSQFRTPRKTYGEGTQKAGQEYGGDVYENVYVEAVKQGKGKVVTSWKSAEGSGSWTAYHRTCSGITTFPIKTKEVDEWLTS